MSVLIVESDPDDAAQLERAITATGRNPSVHVVATGDDALEIVTGGSQQIPRPNLMVLTLGVPGTDGAEILTTLASDPELCTIPVVVLLDSIADGHQPYKHSANACLQKPIGSTAVRELGRSIARFWLEAVHLPPVR